MKIHPIVTLRGSIVSSPSKSYSHRAFAIALGASSSSYIVDPLSEGDVGVTLDFLRAFGAKISKVSYKKFENSETPDQLRLNSSNPVYLVEPPLKKMAPADILDGKNSGTTIRIMSALAGSYSGVSSLTGEFFKRARPMQPLIEALSQIGVECILNSSANTLVITPVSPMSNDIKIPGDISSQFITGLLLLAPHLEENPEAPETNIILTTPAKSYPYLKITEQVLRDFGIQFTAQFDDHLRGRYIIPAAQSYSGRIYRVPGDFSSAAFIVVAAALNPLPYSITVQNLDLQSPQGDKAIISIVQKMGAEISINPLESSITIKGGQFLNGVDIDCSQTPDLFPILCVLGIFANDITRIYNAQHVRVKETDRISVMVRELRKMGAVIRENVDGVLIEGPQSLKGIIIQHDDDHRIAMALVIASLYARNPSEIPSPEIVKDSYPNFISDLSALGCRFD